MLALLFQEQLGYIVFSGVRRSNGAQGLRVIVQSDRNPEYLDKRIEQFLHRYGPIQLSCMILSKPSHNLKVEFGSYNMTLHHSPHSGTLPQVRSVNSVNYH